MLYTRYLLRNILTKKVIPLIKGIGDWIAKQINCYFYICLSLFNNFKRS